MFCIYKIVNPRTLLSYIGYTDDFKRRMAQHRRSLTVGCADFTTEILFDNIPSRAEAGEMEKIFIHFHDTFHNGANKTLGGGPRTGHSQETKSKMSKSSNEYWQDENRSDEHRRKISEVQTGKVLTDEHKRRVSETHKGKTLTDEHKQKLGEVHRGRKQSEEHIQKRVAAHLGQKRSDETKQKMSKIHKGKTLTDEHKQKISESGKGRITSDETKEKIAESKRGKPRSEETKRKLSEANTGKKLSNETKDKISQKNLELMANGTHPFIAINKAKAFKRRKAEWMWIRSLARCWYEMNDHVMNRRAEFYNKEIPDTSSATQTEMF